MAIEFDPLSERFRADPYPHYRRLRDEAPLYRVGDSGPWYVSRYEDVHAVLNDAETYSSRAMFTELMNAGADGPPPMSWNLLRFMFKMVVHARLTPGRFEGARTLIAEDGTRHAETRSIVNRGFTPRRIAGLEPRVREIVSDTLAALRDAPRCDLVRDFAVPVPVTVIAELLGVEPERREDFKRWSDVIVRSTTTAEGREARKKTEPWVADPIADIFTYLRRTARARRAAPQDDLISAIVARQDGEAGLTDHDVVAFVTVLLVAGNETTTNLIGNTMYALLDRPDALRALQCAPERIPAALEEGVRFDAPVQLVFRGVTRPVTLHGQRLEPGDVVVPLIGSANRDERKFEDPDRFAIDREPKGHLGFGFGEHFCLGASLARLEARCALEGLLPELEGWKADVGSRDWIDSFLVRGPTQLLLERAAA